jgi:hypothetical protein
MLGGGGIYPFDTVMTGDGGKEGAGSPPQNRVNNGTIIKKSTVGSV